jgi:hypothetical protein
VFFPPGRGIRGLLVHGVLQVVIVIMDAAINGNQAQTSLPTSLPARKCNINQAQTSLPTSLPARKCMPNNFETCALSQTRTMIDRNCGGIDTRA